MRVLERVVIGLFVVGLVIQAAVHSPTFNEIGHVPSGLAHWKYGRFELYRVNPPFPRMVATIPLLWCPIREDWQGHGTSPVARGEIPAGIRFTRVNGPQSLDYYFAARMSSAVFAVIGAYFCYAWGQKLWGGHAGFVALCLWCFNPGILGHGALVMPDVAAAAMGLGASFQFWRWLESPSWRNAVISGLLLGVAQLCKTSLLILYPLLGIFWCMTTIKTSKEKKRIGPGGGILGLLVIYGLSVYVINLGYAFQGSLRPLGEYRFVSMALSGSHTPEHQGNRFSSTWLRSLPLPLPADYVQGIDRQKADFEVGERSYLRGEWKASGWWYYHLYGFAIKTPVGTLLMLIITGIITALGIRRRSGMKNMVVLAPAVLIFVVVSSQTGFSNHVRYTIPAWPFLFVWASQCAGQDGFRFAKVATAACVAWTMISSLAVFPHSLSYFNEFVGCKQGHEHLLDSNIAWGQDLLFLKKWLEDHPEARPIRVAAFGWTDPTLAGVDIKLPPAGPLVPGTAHDAECRLGPFPGWYAIDVNFLHGTHWPASSGDGTWRELPISGLNYEYFRLFSPVATIGYSMNIYRLELRDVNQTRQQLGMSTLPEN